MLLQMGKLNFTGIMAVGSSLRRGEEGLGVCTTYTGGMPLPPFPLGLLAVVLPVPRLRFVFLLFLLVRRRWLFYWGHTGLTPKSEDKDRPMRTLKIRA